MPGRINVLMAYPGGYLGEPEKLARVCSAAVVACADGAVAPSLLRAGCHAICQNDLQATQQGEITPAEAARAHTLPMFPQQRLLRQRRRASRGHRISHAIFVGDGHQIYPAFRSDAFREALRALGVTFDVVDKSRIPEWSDYRDADLVIALRPPGSQTEMKPPSKLINAWLAGVPALLGPEPAYQRLRQSPHDYIEVNDVKEVVATVAQLQRQPEWYAQMLSRCEERAREYSPEAIAAKWADVLFERIGDWQEEAAIEMY